MACQVTQECADFRLTHLLRVSLLMEEDETVDPADVGLLGPQTAASPVAITSTHWRPASGRAGKTLTLAQLAQASLVVAAPTAAFHGTVERVPRRMKLADRIVVRARHFGALPDLVVNTDLLAIVPEMYANNLKARHDVRSWQLPRAAAPMYEVRLVWHVSTENDPAHQWMRAGARAVRSAHCDRAD